MKKLPSINWESDQEEPPKKRAKKQKAQPAPGNTPTVDQRGFVGGYFKPLGWDSESRFQRFYFYSKLSNAILAFSTSKFTKQHVVQLAPIEFWQNESFDKSEYIADYLITMCNAVGYFDLQSIRGRGAWKESDRIIFHTGMQLLSEKIRYNLGSIDTEFTYEMRKNIRIPIENMMDKLECAKLTRLLSRLNWNTEADGKLLAGWLAIAPVCGALSWRPHCWITGPRGNGKTYVLEQIVHPVLSDFCINAQGTAATEAAIRQKLNSDAMPVTIDESEGNDENAARRMQEVIALARAGSSEKSPAIPKGGKDGKATDYFVRSCFLMVSINPQLVNDSDKRRFTIFELAKHSNQDKFKELNKIKKETITGDFGLRFTARMVNLLPNMLRSIYIFTEAISELVGDRAIADQFGALLGGWWHTWNDDVVEPETALNEAAAILDAKGILEDKEDLTDEQRCLQTILQHETRIEGDFIGTVTVGELVEYASEYEPQAKIKQSAADERLQRLGLRVIEEQKEKYLLILNTSVFVKQVLSRTPWAVSYSTVLTRHPGAGKRNTTRFSSGLIGRCVQINLKNVL
jgi:putative DNA primase/helicase